MKHYTVAVYNLRIKNEGEKSWSEIVQGRLLAGRGGGILIFNLAHSSSLKLSPIR